MIFFLNVKSFVKNVPKCQSICWKMCLGKLTLSYFLLIWTGHERQAAFNWWTQETDSLYQGTRMPFSNPRNGFVQVRIESTPSLLRDDEIKPTVSYIHVFAPWSWNVAYCKLHFGSMFCFTLNVFIELNYTHLMHVSSRLIISTSKFSNSPTVASPSGHPSLWCPLAVILPWGKDDR